MPTGALTAQASAGPSPATVLMVVGIAGIAIGVAALFFLRRATFAGRLARTMLPVFLLGAALLLLGIIEMGA